MSLLIQKFGGSSVATVGHIKRVAEIIKQAIDQGHRVVAVVSAMGDETDRLLSLMNELTLTPPDREYSALLSSGEQVSSALLSMALQQLGVPSQSFNAFQMELLTQQQYRKAHVLSVNTRKLLDEVEQGVVPVITGFQGINQQHEITTLGRGGSDITAVALAAFLDADECQIFTDVDGVFDADPRLLSEARLIPALSYDEMLTFAELGAKVLQTNSVEMARKFHVPLRVLSSLKQSSGTLITEQVDVADTLVSGLACVDHQVKVTLCDLPAQEVSAVLTHMKQELIDYDMLSENHKALHQQDMSFVISESELPLLCQLNDDFHIQTGMAKVSLVGRGMQTHAGFAAKIMQLLSSEGIHIHSIGSTALKVSILVNSSQMKFAIKLLHNEFKLRAQPA